MKKEKLIATITNLIETYEKDYQHAINSGTFNPWCPSYVPNEPLYHRITSLWGDDSWMEYLDIDYTKLEKKEII